MTSPKTNTLAISPDNEKLLEKLMAATEPMVEELSKAGIAFALVAEVNETMMIPCNFEGEDDKFLFLVQAAASVADAAGLKFEFKLFDTEGNVVFEEKSATSPDNVPLNDQKPTSPAPEPHAGIICREHGKVDLTGQQYTEQMLRPDSLWKCPRCGQDAEFDDARFEELNGEGMEEQES